MSGVLVTEGDELDGMTGPELAAVIRQGINVTIPNTLKRVAKAWYLAERLGVDLSEFEEWARLYRVRQMAHGRLLPELAAAVGLHNFGVLNELLKVTPDEQRQILEAKGLEVAERVGSDYTVRKFPLETLKVAQCRIAIGHAGLRGKAEQAVELERSRSRPTRARPAPRVMIDPVTRTLAIGGPPVPIADVVAALRKARAI